MNVLLECVKLLSVHNVFNLPGMFDIREYPSDIIYTFALLLHKLDLLE